MGFIGRLFQLVGVLFLLLVGVSTYLYFVDYGVEATVTAKGEDHAGHYIVLTTTLGEFEMRHHVPFESWELIEPGHHVVYHIQTGTVNVFTARGGDLLYASE